MSSQDVYDLFLEVYDLETGTTAEHGENEALALARALIVNEEGYPLLDSSNFGGDGTKGQIEEGLRLASGHSLYSEHVFRLYAQDESDVPMVFWACRGKVVRIESEVVTPYVLVDTLLNADPNETLVLRPGQDRGSQGWMLM